MSKPLSEMTLEELWELFPIFLTEHQDCWAGWYREESALLRGHLGPGPVVSHIGSTAIAGIWAKPIVDILIELEDRAALAQTCGRLQAAGYVLMSGGEERASLNKGYTPEGFAERVFHIHLRLNGDHDELYFRDYLNSHPEAAREYEALKLLLWREYEHDRDEYTRQKAAFVAEYTALAKEEYAGRYAWPEALVREGLPAREQEAPLKFLAALRGAGMAFERAGGYWTGQYYWVVRYLGEPVCFLLLNGTGDEAPMAPLTVWTDDSGSPWYEEGPLSPRERALAWAHVDICGHCGSCAGGTRKLVFGRAFENVCRTTLRFTAPDGEELELVKKLTDLRKGDIDRRK